MSRADKIFKDMCTSILEESRGKKIRVRPHWEDGTPAYVIKKFGVCNTYDLRDEFPAITIRKTAIKSASDEMLWIYQKKSNNINDLNSHVWDEWADEKGSIGKAYGYQVRQKAIYPLEERYRDIKTETDLSALSEAYSMYPSACINISNDNVYLDQMDAVLYTLKHDPFSRRIMINLWNVSELHEMNLQPCAYSCTFNVTDEGCDKPILNLLLNQRSQDVLAANNWNVVQYAILLMMVAQVSNMIPGKLIHMIADAHIYDRHIPIIKELIQRDEYPAPTVMLNPDIKNFYDFKTSDIVVSNYFTQQQIKDIPIAI